MVFNTTFNNISVISWRSVLLAEETGVPRENRLQSLSHNVVSSTPRHEQESKSQCFFLITDFIALIAVNNLLDIQLLPSIPSC